ncbi:MAG: hypothetical protein PHD51_00830 [Patescibacteria group bacterium]|nr:hypothetical protein [Patescibacteria group bacterium]MDD5490592.1 hypothetical protein [Patescibacteria group bacterium]
MGANICECGKPANDSVSEQDKDGRTITLFGCPCQKVWVVTECHHCGSVIDEREKPKKCSCCGHFICPKCGRCSPNCEH